ncbi:RNA polymerase factor sigma-54 [Treponema putidum]|uniref:RNA polymerase factor sigma-54 n=1 Tax=Treponema putidum TaxID=221027 RepID=A0ABY5HRW2_9SPIR|nr:RNA polymerase factor sigma-54 [Treponema putidum]UTY28178.1 RNA polymerase factor sigma-54 [Treponema putidum]
MILKQRQQQILSQKMVMNQQMLNAVALLNLSTEELQEEVIKEVKRNPALIFKTSSRVSAASTEEGDKHQSFLESIEDDSRKTLQAHLIEQAGESIADEYVLDAAMLIIQNLDRNGFYWVPLEELFADMLSEKKIKHTEIKKALNIVRRLEPIGCACTGIKESLIVQAGILCESPKTHEILDIYKNIHSLCVKIIKEHYEVLVFVSDLKLFIKKLAQKKIVIDMETAEDLAELINSLNPKPGLAYSREAVDEKFIVPVAEIKREGNEFKIIINDEEVPALEISPEYERIKNSGSREEKKEASDFLNKASLFMSVLAYRNQTILKVLTAIVHFQEPFFLGRPCKPSVEVESEKMQAGYLKPLKQIDIAEIVGLSPSTVSRVSNQKYIRCEWGIFEIKDLFSPEVSGGLSKDYVEKAIREIIESDTEKKTDARISQILKERGIDIAVRTVNKYRKEIGLPSSYNRS